MNCTIAANIVLKKKKHIQILPKFTSLQFHQQERRLQLNMSKSGYIQDNFPVKSDSLCLKADQLNRINEIWIIGTLATDVEVHQQFLTTHRPVEKVCYIFLKESKSSVKNWFAS